MTQGRDTAGQYTAVAHTPPEMGLSPSSADIEGLRATLVDFLEGSLPGFGVHVTDVEPAVDELVSALVAQHMAGA